jgi:ABC-type multidrug transport system fused ATPase/permease subunit
VIELGATPGEFVSFITAFLLAYEPAKRIARLHISLTRNLIAVRTVIEILDSTPLEPEELDTEDVSLAGQESHSIMSSLLTSPVSPCFVEFHSSPKQDK